MLANQWHVLGEIYYSNVAMMYDLRNTFRLLVEHFLPMHLARSVSLFHLMICYDLPKMKLDGLEAPL